MAKKPLLVSLVALALAGLGLVVWLGGGERFVARWWGAPLKISGIVWQVTGPTTGITGNWGELGIDHLLIQWSEVDDTAFIGPAARQPPDWLRISREPWARHVILGLAGRFDEKQSRANVLELARAGAELAKIPLPLDVEGYYFPVEVDPTWKQAPEVVGPALALLPRPLWISVYDSANVGADKLADWLAGWLPPDVGVFFQDGVGVEARTPAVARQYADALAKKLGHARVKVIVEAFRPMAGKFRPATAQELLPQIKAMQGYDIYLFDGPHYLDDAHVRALAEAMKGG